MKITIENNIEIKQELQGGVSFTSEVQECNKQVSVLDRSDSFQKLVTDERWFGECVVSDDGSIVYGIRRPDNAGMGKNFFPHQKTSVEEFLAFHRGFGLLADIVGSGKTYEAGWVLSELGHRDLISSMLLIVPSNVLGDWIKVIEKDFGLGKWKDGMTPDPNRKDEEPVVFKHVGDSLPANLFTRVGEYEVPVAPIIVTMEDFNKWEKSSLNNKLFEVIVVDEVHEFSKEKGDYPNAMCYLSILTQTKKRADKTYCVLLSATPHTGNLADMFRLWYFIRCKGGNPNDFEIGRVHTADYEAEKTFYENEICYGAKTVMDFVRKKKISLLRGNDAVFVKEYDAYLTKRGEDFFDMEEAERIASVEEFLDGYLARSKFKTKKEFIRDYILKYYGKNAPIAVESARKAFDEYLAKNRRLDEFDYGYEGIKEKDINDFLAENISVRDLIKELIATDYHNGVLRTIMIRQPQKTVTKTTSRKHVKNFFFFRVPEKETEKKKSAKKAVEEIALRGVGDGKQTVVLKLDKNKLDYMNDPQAVYLTDERGNVLTDGGGNKLYYSAPGCCNKIKGMEDAGIVYGRLVKKVLEYYGLSDGDSEALYPRKLENTDELNEEYPYHFHKAESVSFYESRVSEISRNILPGNASVDCCFEPIFGNATELQFKMEKLKQILRAHPEKNVLVFFDYDISDTEDVRRAVFDELSKDKEFSSRLVDIWDNCKDEELKKRIDAKQQDGMGAIVVAVDQKWTQGSNLQMCNIIVNFQITPDPLRMQQQIGRVYRLGQLDDIIIYSLADMNKLEGYLLAYFSEIGLMSGDTGDAEILAGCNNNMVTVRCNHPSCGSIKMFTLEDFETEAQNVRGAELLEGKKVSGPKYVLCTDPRCGRKGKMTRITEISAKCDSCGHVITRSAISNRYMCLKQAHDGVMEIKSATKTDSPVYHCNHVCALSHCKKYMEGGEMAGKCKMLETYRRYKDMTRPDVQVACKMCMYKAECCFAKAMETAAKDDTLNPAEALAKMCSGCIHATCRPKPHVIEFKKQQGDEEMWIASCPVCRANGKNGRLKSQLSSSFSAYIKSLFDYELDKGADFCKNFNGEIGKVLEVQDILRSDNLKEKKNHANNR